MDIDAVVSVGRVVVVGKEFGYDQFLFTFHVSRSRYMYSLLVERARVN